LPRQEGCLGFSDYFKWFSLFLNREAFWLKAYLQVLKAF